MKIRRTVIALLAFPVFSFIAFAQEHDTHSLGKVHFQNSCSTAVQEDLQRAVAMLHSFKYSDTEAAFRKVLETDPSCGIATWGIASILMSNPLAGIGPTSEAAKRAQAVIEEGRKIGAKTQRERDYIEAVAAYYEDWANRPETERQLNRARAFEVLAKRYPDDDEAQIFYALYLAGTQSLDDQTYKAYLAAAEILEKQFQKHPDHPGVAHYLIHSYDAPPIAAKGLPAARRYAGIAPAAAHALHMPSHIFTRVGLWAESAATNERSRASAKQNNDYDEQLHAMDYMVYAYLQLGRDADALRIVEQADSVTGRKSLGFAGPYGLAAIPARYAVERGDWKAAMALQPRPSPFRFTMALTRFARAIGAARSGNTKAAEAEVQELGRLRDALKAEKKDYWAAEAETSRLAAAAWTALALGKKDEALTLMRNAADLEDRNEKHIVTPGRILPAREMLGEMLLEVDRPAEALKEFEASQALEPERFRGYYGAAQAAAKSGDMAKAKLYFARLSQLVDSGSTRKEAITARDFLAANP